MRSLLGATRRVVLRCFGSALGTTPRRVVASFLPSCVRLPLRPPHATAAAVTAGRFLRRRIEKDAGVGCDRGTRASRERTTELARPPSSFHCATESSPRALRPTAARRRSRRGGASVATTMGGGRWRRRSSMRARPPRPPRCRGGGRSSRRRHSTSTTATARSATRRRRPCCARSARRARSRCARRRAWTCVRVSSGARRE